MTRIGTLPEKRDPLQNAGALLNLFYPGSFPDPLHLPIEPEETAPEPKRAGYDLDGAAAYLNMTRRKLRSLITQKRIRCTRIDSRNFLFGETDLTEFLATYKTKPRRI